MNEQMKRELLDSLIPILNTLWNADMMKIYDLAAALREEIAHTPPTEN